jgi:hypothetical protein
VEEGLRILARRKVAERSLGTQMWERWMLGAWRLAILCRRVWDEGSSVRVPLDTSVSGEKAV